jgi:hypothetical protein
MAMRIEPNSTGLPDEALTIAEETSTPDVYDEWYTTTHKNAKASWDDVVEADDSDECENDSFDDEDLI